MALLFSSFFPQNYFNGVNFIISYVFLPNLSRMSKERIYCLLDPKKQKHAAQIVSSVKFERVRFFTTN